MGNYPRQRHIQLFARIRSEVQMTRFAPACIPRPGDSPLRAFRRHVERVRPPFLLHNGLHSYSFFRADLLRNRISAFILQLPELPELLSSITVKSNGPMTPLNGGSEKLLRQI